MSPVVGFAQGLSGHPALHWAFLFSYAWLEAPLAACIARLADVPNWQDLTAWPSGRVFGNLAEYRWQRNAKNSLHAVLLLEQPPLPADFEPGMPLQQGSDSALILWGEWVDPKKDPQANPDGGPSFYANEIPRVQTYPIDLKGPPQEDERLRLIVRRYCASDKDAGEFVRCVGFMMKGRVEET